MESRMITRLGLCLLLVGQIGLSTACASSPRADEENVQQSVDDKIYDYRTVLRQLRGHEVAAEAARELDLVDLWLDRVERMIADEEDEELIELQLQAIEGQLVRVRSYYARREAELELERARASYEGRMKNIQAQRDRNAAQLEPLEQEGK